VRDVLIVAGEASGDMHAGALARELTSLRPDLRLTGIGGAQMADAGVQMLARTGGVFGFVEILRHLPEHWRLMRLARERLSSGQVSLAILVDYGGFNLRVAAEAKRAGVPVLYYITPQVWASRPKRMATMAQVITRAAVILPFEEELLRKNGVNATFVGHPLIDRLASSASRDATRQKLGIGSNDRLLALFPGSREQEVRYHSEDFAAVARELERRRPGLRVLVGVAPTVSIDSSVLPYRAAGVSSIELLRAADVALCKSGTTTLEAAIAGCPSAIVYRTNAITYEIGKRVVNIAQIGLVNIVGGRAIVPEFVQGDFVPLRVADALDPLFDDGPARKAMVQGLAEVRERLGAAGASGRVAKIAAEMAK
jgi:lipid-A-disaccharide synthase